MRKLGYIGIVMLLFAGLKAQQYSLYNLYYQSRYFVNPAAIGDSMYKVNFIHRNQWVGMPGAPVVNFVNAEIPINDKIAVGAQFMNDKIHIFNKSVFNATGVYKLMVSSGHRINFGLSVGFLQNSIQSYNANVVDVDDPVYLNSGAQGTQFNADFGLSYEWDKGLYAGISVPQLIGNYVRLNKSEVTNSYYGIKRHFLGYIGYNYLVTSDWKLQPEVFTRYNVESKQIQADIAVRAYWKNWAWAGAFYRTNAQFGFTVGGSVMEIVDLGYSVEFNTGPISKGNGSSHELFIGVKINKYRSNPNQKDAYTKDTVFVTQIDTVYMDSSAIDLADTLELDSVQLDSNQVDSLDLGLINDSLLNSDIDTNEILDRMPDVEFDLPRGYYIIHGSFTEKARADAMVEAYRREGLNSFVAQDKTKMYNRVIISFSQDREEATQKLIEIQEKYFREAWFFTVK